MWQFLTVLLLGGLLIAPGQDQLILNSDNNLPWRDFSNRSTGVAITARSALVVDKETDQILYSQAADQISPLASITKLMTAIVFLQTSPDWQATVTMEPRDEVYRPKYVYRGEEISVQDLFWTMLIGSDNNAAVALVRSTGLTIDEFVKKMNEQAAILGLENTTFVDPTGLSAENLSTAYDVWRLAKTAWQYEEISQPTARNDFLLTVQNTNSVRRVINTNKLLDSFLHVLAGKTGYIDEAGYCLVALVNGEQNNQIFTIVMGSKSEADRWQDAKALAWWVFSNWQWR